MTKVMHIREKGGQGRAVTLYRSASGTLYAQSQSKPNTMYCLGTNGDRCQCLGYQHRQTCKHVQAAALFIRMSTPQPQPTKAACKGCGKTWDADALTGGDCPVCLLWPGR